MHVSEPLSSMFSPAEAQALEVLARANTEFTGRQVARLASGTPAGIRKALLRLVETGLVLMRPEPHATYFRANRDHVLWGAVEIALGAPRELERRVAEFSTMHVPESTVAVYGSVARRDSTPSSDIDLLVVHPDNVTIEARDEFSEELREQLEAWSGNPVQIYDVDHTTLRSQYKRHDPIVEQWQQQARTIAGPPLAKILGAH